MHRTIRGQSFIEVLLPDRVGRNGKLERLEAMLDWKELANVVKGIYAAPSGRPSYPPVVMVKVMVLQQWYDASDEAIEEALWDRVSFKRFVGLGLEDAVPDHSTISRFRREVTERGLALRLFKEMDRQLAQRNLFVKKGTLLDATIVASFAARETRAATPMRGSRAKFGYKAHQGLIREAVLTPARERYQALVRGMRRRCMRTRPTGQRSAWLKSLGIKDRIALSTAAVGGGEGVWDAEADLLARNATELFFKCAAYNLRRKTAGGGVCPQGVEAPGKP